MRWLLGAAVLFVATGAAAQTIVDGSGGTIPAQRLQEALQIVSSTFPDPKSTQFRKLASALEQTLLCGEVNAKNAAGAYTGYRAFHMVGTRTPTLASDADDPDYELFSIAMDNCRGQKN